METIKLKDAKESLKLEMQKILGLNLRGVGLAGDVLAVRVFSETDKEKVPREWEGFVVECLAVGNISAQ